MNNVTPREHNEALIHALEAKLDAWVLTHDREFTEYKATTERALKLLATQRAAAIAVTLATLSLIVATFVAVVIYLKP